MVDIQEASEHVKDAVYFHLPFGTHLELPKVLGFQLTKFMVLELVAAGLMLAVFIPLARRISSGKPVRGRLANMFEMMLLFVRDEMVRPAIGRGEADRFLPLIWTMFFFVLLCNLLGMIPWAGSPTAAFAVTGALAAIMFSTSLGTGIKRFGVVGFLVGQVPHMDLPLVLAIFLKPMILFLEVFGMLIKHTVLGVRLLANMFAGHLVLAVILGFIAAFAHSWMWYGVLPASILGATALSLLELFVAFLQAYIFAFLSALFIGMVIHPH